MGVADAAAAVLAVLIAAAAPTLERLLRPAGQEAGPARPTAVRNSLDLSNADRWLLPAGPITALAGAALGMAVIPFGPGLIGRDLGIGVFYFIVVIDIVVLGIALAGWGVRGLGRRAPWAAVALTLALLSLAGIPPLAGFAGKVLLLGAAIDGGMTWLAVFAAVNMAVALIYYVRVVAEMYFAADADAPPLAIGKGYAATMLLTTAGTLAIGILPALGLAPIALGAALLR